MHIDQTYVFYAGKEYFLKEGTMEAAKDFEFNTMRDDEWVLSGYSFTDKVLIDGTGRLREGEISAGEAEDLQGVGFYHADSRDAFIALWLEHTAAGFDGLVRNGLPTLHYHQHGQLWSRYPLGDGEHQFKRGTVLQQRNAYLIAPYPNEGAARQIESLRKRLIQSVRVGRGCFSIGWPAIFGGVSSGRSLYVTRQMRPWL